ncbi:MAG: hypothetical protein IPP97_02765 [Candidatus Obscuribacter sp.]|nr:hypothetical protein [Candidatus Obscuribacter sp.]
MTLPVENRKGLPSAVPLTPESLNVQTQTTKAIAYMKSLEGSPQPHMQSRDISSLAEPLAKLKALKKGWDGENADCPTDGVLLRAQELLDNFYKANLLGIAYPKIFPGKENIISFTWSVPAKKRLDIWVRDFDEDCFADFALSSERTQISSGFVQEAKNLIDVLYQYFQV